MEQSKLARELQRIRNSVDALLGLVAPTPAPVVAITPPVEVESAPGTQLQQQPPAPVAPVVITQRKLVWGERVSLPFRQGVLWIEDQLGLNADNLMSCIAFETGCTFDPAKKNLAGSSGTGLIQFMRATALGLGTTVEQLAAMTPEKQLGYVYHYFKKQRADWHGTSLEDTYMAILFPAAIGKPNDWVMPWEFGSLAFKENSGLDLNKDHSITKAEAAAGPRRMFELGKQFAA